MEALSISKAEGTAAQPLVSIPRESHFSGIAEEVVLAAEGGDPQALRQVLLALVGALGGSQAMPCGYAVFCADALRTLLDDTEAWGANGRNLTDKDRQKFGRAFCRAFRLSKSQATLREGEIPMINAACPAAVLKFEELLLYGVSRRAATSVILTAFQEPGHRTLEDWLRFLKTRSVKLGTLGEHSLIDHRHAIAAEVERARTRHCGLEEAYLMAARGLACKLFPDFRAQIVRWATRLLRDARRRRRAPDQVEFAQQVITAVEQGSPLPPIPEELSDRIVPRIKAERVTRLPESAVHELLPAVQVAYRFALSLAGR